MSRHRYLVFADGAPADQPSWGFDDLDDAIRSVLGYGEEKCEIRDTSAGTVIAIGAGDRARVRQPAQERAQRDAFVAGLRDLADFLESTPAAPVPYEVTCRRHLTSRDAFVAAARALGRAEKDFTDPDYALVIRRFGPHTIAYQAVREDVCERVVTGTRKVTVEEPDPKAVEALPKVTRTEVVEDVEWRCEPLLTPAGDVAA